MIKCSLNLHVYVDKVTAEGRVSDTCTWACSGATSLSRKVQTTHKSTDGWTHCGVHTHERYPALERKFWHVTTWVTLEDIMLSDADKHKNTNTAWFHSREGPRVHRFIEAERKTPGAGRTWSQGIAETELLYQKTQAKLRRRMVAMDTQQGEGTQHHWTACLQTAKMVSFVSCIFDHDHL